MYEEVSLTALLVDAGCVDVETLSANDSHIPGWSEIGLDLLADGTPYKEMSLYMKARKPPFPPKTK